VESQLGLKIQSGAHSSITDARATMALYRLHKEAWEASLRGVMEAYAKKTGTAMPGKKGKGKRKREDDEGEEEGKNGTKADLEWVERRCQAVWEEGRGPAQAARTGASQHRRRRELVGGVGIGTEHRA
jgi:RNA exonuclease 4